MASLVDTQGKIYVSDLATTGVQVFDPTGAYLTTIGGVMGDELSPVCRNNVALLVDSEGNVYVSDQWK